jgi:alpha/beta superfamily hydrolase
MKKLGALLFICLIHLCTKAQIKKETLEFAFEGVMLNGVLNMPDSITPRGIILIVHGSGQTNAVEQEWYYDIRKTFIKSGYATYMWDKMGCGKSKGTFNYNQSVQNSALEVIAAINALKQKAILGTNEIGLWGISRAGWIIPLVINQYQDIKFWISVSGVDEKENFKYLLKENLRINGYSKDTINLLVKEWQKSILLSHKGGNFKAYQQATPNLQQNKFWLRFTNGGITPESYKTGQQELMKQKLDKKSGLPIYIQGFEAMLSNINCPVLAIFGEKDMNVDWTQTQALYQKTLGKNTSLTIKSFPDCNHNLFQCETGGFYEIQDNKMPWNRCTGFLDAMANWLIKKDKLPATKNKQN